eukprot:m.305677 g.305677  ORF g.305677 m.305677 type:complete len:391 (+) comp16450_c0_seq16:183-1355(+)
MNDKESLMLMFSFIIYLASPVSTTTVTIRNDIPRLDGNGRIVDAHSGNVVYHAKSKTFFLYGERYGNATGMDYQWVQPGPNQAPKLGVYTSSDLIHWEDRGLCLTPSDETNWIPMVFFDDKTDKFIAWWAGWGVGVSQDGIHFQRLGEAKSRLTGWRVAGPHILIDDDRTGYIIFDATAPNHPLKKSHIVSIEKLTSDYTNSTKENVTGFFPDYFVEAPTLFKRNGIYYATYGTCCCACREGSGLVVFQAKNISGPWIRQPKPYSNVNCRNKNVSVCRGRGLYPSKPTINNPTIPAQGYSITAIPKKPTADGEVEMQYLWMANRWLQGSGNNGTCTNLCDKSAPEACTTQGQPEYRVGRDPTYWALLDFDDDGNVLPLVWQDSFEIELPF